MTALLAWWSPENFHMWIGRQSLKQSSDHSNMELKCGLFSSPLMAQWSSSGARKSENVLLGKRVLKKQLLICPSLAKCRIALKVRCTFLTTFTKSTLHNPYYLVAYLPQTWIGVYASFYNLVNGHPAPRHSQYWKDFPLTHGASTRVGCISATKVSKQLTK